MRGGSRGVSDGGVENDGAKGFGVNALFTDTNIAIGTRLYLAPITDSAVKIHTPSQRTFIRFLANRGVYVISLYPAQPRSTEKHPLSVLLGLIWSRCGPAKFNGEALKATSTGMVIESSVVSLFRKLGYETGDGRDAKDTYKDRGGGNFSDNPGQAPAVKNLIDFLAERGVDENVGWAVVV